MPEVLGRLRTPRLAAAPSSPTVGEVYYDTTTNVLYWQNGTSWISSGAGAASTTPPTSPVDGQPWIYPVDTTSGIMWEFRYRAASASAYKWEFIGGASLRQASAINAVLNTLTQVGATGHFYDNAATPTVPRAGDYEIAGSIVFDANGSPGQPQARGFAGAVLADYYAAPTHVDTTVNSQGTAAGVWFISGVAASAKIGIAGGGTNPPVHKLVAMHATVRPVRVG